MSSRQHDEEGIFHIARKLPDADARADYLEQVCSADQALRERVEAMLKVHEQEKSFLKSKNAEPAPTVDTPPLTERPGTSIGRYQLMEQIGEGGMGIVFVAQQTKPLTRKVALKVIKPGMDTKEVIARFEAERRALAIMDHSSIARVFDAGTTDSGRPYFVMELVRGVPITEYCDENKLSIRERLDLFIQVCQAIQHAHQKGIIHRDIKPTNVLVTEQDGKAMPKVIDFGVAKALNQNLADRTLYTSHQAIIGTPLYMSPEQAALSNVDVDTRSDVYALGVLLYELLTGATPFDRRQFENIAIAEIHRFIRETEPPKPSTKISKMGKAASAVSTRRDTSPEKLHQMVNGDLDWIVMKALEKDRNRRFETASALADDVRRSLNDEPIEARPPSAMYRASKMVRRNRVLVMVACLLVVSSMVAFAGVVKGKFDSDDAAVIAVKARRDAEKAKEETEAALGSAEDAYRKQEAAIAELRDGIYQRAMLAIISGSEEERVRGLIDEAKDAEVRESRISVLKGVMAFYADRPLEAIEWLEKGEKSVASQSVLAWAHVAAGNHKLAILNNRSLHPTEELLPIDRLLRGQFLSVVMPKEALEDLNEALKTFDTSIYALTLHATAEAFAGWQDDDPELVKRAYERIRAAHRLKPDNKFVLLASSQAYLVQFRMLLRANERVDSDFLDEAKKIAAKCREQSSRNNAFIGNELVAELGDVEGAVDMILMTMKTGGFGFTPMLLVPKAILAGKETETIDALRQFESEEDVFTQIALKALEIDEATDRQEVIDMVNETVRNYVSADARMYALRLLLMIKEPVLATKKAREMLATTEEMVLPYKSHIAYLAGNLDEDELLAVSPRTGHFDIGLKAWAEGDMKAAKASFLRSCEVDIYMCQYWWSRVFLKRIEQEPAND